MKKCVFFKSSIQYVGHIIDKQGIRPNLSTIEAIQKPKTPTPVTEAWVLIGICVYYRKFVDRFSDLAIPVIMLTRKNVPFEWTEECQTAFEKLKCKLMTTPVFAFSDQSKHSVI